MSIAFHLSLDSADRKLLVQLAEDIHIMSTTFQQLSDDFATFQSDFTVFVSEVRQALADLAASGGVTPTQQMILDQVDSGLATFDAQVKSISFPSVPPPVPVPTPIPVPVPGVPTPVPGGAGVASPSSPASPAGPPQAVAGVDFTPAVAGDFTHAVAGVDFTPAVPGDGTFTTTHNG